MLDTPKGKVLEVFRSIQGEGKYVGQDQVFLRFFECNMHCVWCDTPHSIGDGRKEYQEYSVEELLDKMAPFQGGCSSISLTGGEPLLQKDFIKELTPFLKEAGMAIHLETNATLPENLQDVIEDVDVVAMDLKLPSSTKCQSFWKEHAEFLKIALAKEAFIKTVVSSEALQEDLVQAVDVVKGIAPDILFILQPNYFEMKNGVLEKCLKWQTYCAKHLNNVRILPQVHKFMKLR